MAENKTTQVNTPVNVLSEKKTNRFKYFIDDFLITERFIYYIYPPIMIVIIVFLFVIITCFTKDVSFFKIDPGASGFKHFTNTFSIVFKLILFFITTWGILTALLKYRQADMHFNKQLNLTKKISDLSQQPIITIGKLRPHIVQQGEPNYLSLSIDCQNSGNYIGKIDSFDVEIFKNNSSVFTDKVQYNRIIPQGTTPNLNPPLLKCSLDDNFFKVGEIEIIIKINYTGINDIKHQTVEKFKYKNKSNTYFPLESNWYIDIQDIP